MENLTTFTLNNFANIKFYYPESLEFECCLDSMEGSGHFLFEKNDQEKTPVISLFHYSLSGCLSGKYDCSLDEVVSKTSKEKLRE